MRRPLAWRVLAMALLVGALAALSRCAPHPHGARSGDEAVLRRGNGPEPESLDLHRARSEAALTILRDLYEGLTAIGSDGSPQLAAAQAYEVSADGLHYVFHLRAQARWSNGDALVAEDFVAAWQRLCDPHTAAQYAQLLEPIAGAAAIAAGQAPAASLGAHAADAATLEVDLARPTPYFLALLAHPATFPLHRASLAALGRGFAKPGKLISNGAFVLTRWDFGSHVVARRNPRYWNAAATKIAAVEYYSSNDPSAELAAFRSGSLDVTAGIPAAQFGWIQANLPQQLQLAPQLAVYYLGLNLRTVPFAASVPLRRALSMVIDREALTAQVTAAGEIPAYSFVPPATRDYTPQLPEYAGWPLSQRIAAARTLLAAAGGAGALPPLELRYNSGELHQRIAVAVAAMWKQALGVTVTLHAEEFKVLLEDIDRGTDTPIFRASWLADYDDAYSFLQLLSSGFGINLPRYTNPEYDRLLRAAGEVRSAAERRQLLESAERTMLADQPVIPLYFYRAKHLVSTHVHGWQRNVMNVSYSRLLSKDAP